MKKGLFSFYLVIFAHLLFAQEYSEFHNIYVCKNPNGVVETLKIGATKVYYFSTVFPKEVELKVKKASNSIFVSFPNETKMYKLVISFINLECINPDGTIQIFSKETKTDRNLGTYKTKAKNGVSEFLDFRYDKDADAKNPSVYYWTSTNPQKINLISKNTAIQFENEPVCSGNFLSCEIQFPNDKTIYKITFKNEEKKMFDYYLICKNNTNNITQRFEWIRK